MLFDDSRAKLPRTEAGSNRLLRCDCLRKITHMVEAG